MPPHLMHFDQLQKTINPHLTLRVSGKVDGGGILLVRGPSGSGKSTLLRMLARLVSVEGGMVWFQGTEWGFFKAPEWRMKVHYIPQKPVMFQGSCEDNLRLPFSLQEVKARLDFDLKQVEYYMDHLLLSRELLRQEARTLSGGEASRLALVRGLLLRPRVLLLDEPTAYLDSRARQLLLQLLQQWLQEERERGIIMVSHSENDEGSLHSYGILDLPGQDRE